MAKDDLDKLLVQKYSDMYTVNPKNYGKSFPPTDYQSIIDKLEYFLDYNNSQYEEYEQDERENSAEVEMNDIEENEKYTSAHDNCYKRLGVDVLRLDIGEGVVSFVENLLLPKIKELRIRLTDSYGYIIPDVRVMDNPDLNKYDYTIYVRDKNVYMGSVCEFFNNNPCGTELTKYIKSTEEIINRLEEVCFAQANRLITKKCAIKMMELVRSDDPTLVNDLIPVFISAIDLKNILANLISMKISVKDVILLFELLNDYARYTQDVQELTARLAKEM